MRILFICTSIEPGHDGVGDYVRLLAGACIRLGHECAIIALHDRYVSEPVDSGPQIEQRNLTYLRLSSQQSWPERIERSLSLQSRFQPDVISLQIVPYGFDNKGILLKLIPFLKTLTAHYPLHIMFHELWIGGGIFTPSRRRLVGAIQKQSLKRMLTLLKPQSVTTSNPVYAMMLGKIGVPAVILPLFGNIPLNPICSLAELPANLIEAGITRDGSERDAWWLAVFFGSLHPEWKPEPLMGIVRRAARRAHKRVAFILAGRAGTLGNEKWESLRNRYRSDFLFIKVGEQPVENLSFLLQIADFGIAASPWQLLGKSGTVAAMLDHGLPVIVTRDDFQPLHFQGKNTTVDPLLHRCDHALEAKLQAGLAKRAPHLRLDEIASRFCGLIGNLSHGTP